MRTPDDLYRLEPGTVPEESVPVLVHTLQGTMDAGHAGALVAQHILRTLPVERLATFDVDQLVDYRSRRPAMTFESTGWVDYDAPEIAVDLVRDASGSPFLLLHGAEPDLQWERFAAAVSEIVHRLGVRTTIGVHGIPMGVPHTRPMTITAHGTRPDLVAGHPIVFGRIQVPGSAGAHLEYRLGEQGRDAIGFAANVPHYLTQMPYPPAAAELIRQIAHRSGLQIPLGDLEQVGQEVTAAIDRQVAESAEIGAVVHALEQQFDAVTGSQGRSSLLMDRSEIPSADEIAAEFEEFLKQQGEEQGPDEGRGRETDPGSPEGGDSH